MGGSRISALRWNPVARVMALFFFAIAIGSPSTQVKAGGGTPAHDIDFEFTDFTANGTRRLPLGDNLKLVNTRIDFSLNAEQGGSGNTMLLDNGDGDLILELGESVFVLSEFTIFLDITFTDIDPDSEANFAHAFAGPPLGTVISFEAVEFQFADDPLFLPCDIDVGAFGGCGVLLDTDDYDLIVANDPLQLGFDVNDDTVDDAITTIVGPGSVEGRQPGIEIDFGNNPDTQVVNGEVVQRYIFELDWAIQINPEVDIALNGLATIKTTSDPLTVVPVPGALWLFAAGLCGLVRAGRRATR